MTTGSAVFFKKLILISKFSVLMKFIVYLPASPELVVIFVQGLGKKQIKNSTLSVSECNQKPNKLTAYDELLAL